jgi:hypothetical protein
MGDAQWQELEGSSYLVISKGEKYAAIADAIQRSTRALDQIVDEIDTKSLAMDETRKLAETVKESIDKARDRYHETGEALKAYGSALDAAQDKADPAARELRRLRDELSTAQGQASSAGAAVDDLPSNATPEERAEATSAQSRADGRVSDLTSSIGYWEGEWSDGKQQKDDAASTAISRIEEVVTGKNTHGLEDGFWDKAGEVWDSVYKVVKVICDVAGILAIFLSWVPILGQILLVLAAVGAILAVLDAVFKAVRGDGSWWGVLGAAALGALTLFGGRAVTALAKYAKARTVVQSAARMSPRVAKSTFGTATLKSSRKIFAMSKGQRVTDVLKGPFVRTTTDKAVAGMFRGGHYQQGLKQMFPNPFTGSGLRTIFGNDDVTDMFRVMNTTGAHLDTATAVTSSIAAVGAHGIVAFNGVRNAVSIASEMGYGDFGEGLTPGVSLGSQPLGGPYGNIVGGVLGLTEGVSNPTGDAVPVGGGS